MKIPADVRPENICAIVDTREQDPLDLAPLRVLPGTLATGDYSVAGIEHLVAVERKSLADLLACVGRERERFDRECQRLLGYDTRAIVVEGEWADLERGDWPSRVTPAAAVGSLLGWVALGIPILMAGGHERAGRYVSRLLYIAARRRYREIRALVMRAESTEADR
ncbi:MAG TPA: ERCC4 domain-containing protein [Pirellulales bacterium]|nr:ERCC4 domain-containing protein [Pirellulales bacterium]